MTQVIFFLSRYFPKKFEILLRKKILYINCCRCCSVTQSHSTLCDPTDCSMAGFPVLHSIQSLLKLMCIESVMPFNNLILCWPLLLLPSIFPSIKVFSNDLAL